MLLFAALAGCAFGSGGISHADRIQQKYENLAQAQFHVQMTVNLGQSTLDYEMDYAYNKEDSDTFIITAPEVLAGVGARISGENSSEFVLQYQDTVLDTPGSVRDGATPADVMAYTMQALRAVGASEVWTEKSEETQYTVIKFEQTSGEDILTRQVWLAEPLAQPARVEVYAEGELVLSCVVTNWQEREAPQE